MTIRELLATRTPTLSYELFPPRTPAAEETLAQTMDMLAATKPDFMSITYGASGSTRSTSREVVHRLAVAHTIPPLAHLTCVDQSRAELIAVTGVPLGQGAGMLSWLPAAIDREQVLADVTEGLNVVIDRALVDHPGFSVRRHVLDGSGAVVGRMSGATDRRQANGPSHCRPCSLPGAVSMAIAMRRSRSSAALSITSLMVSARAPMSPPIASGAMKSA